MQHASADLFLPSLGMSVGSVLASRNDGSGRRQSVTYAPVSGLSAPSKGKTDAQKHSRQNAYLPSGSHVASVNATGSRRSVDWCRTIGGRRGSVGAGRRGSVGGRRASVAKVRQSVVEIPDLGIGHTARMMKDCQSASNDAPAETSCIMTMSAAAEDYFALETAALEAMAPHIAKLPLQSVLVEIGSRYGEFTSMAAEKFQQHQVQPTEGTGQTAPGLFLLLQERVTKHNEEHPMRKHQEHGGGRLMPPKHLDADNGTWAADLGRTDVGCVFAINVLHFVRKNTLESILKGCRQVLRPGGVAFFCGPFFNDGEISESNLASHGLLQTYAKSISGDPLRENIQFDIQWGLHDLQHMRECAEKIGLEFVEQRRVGGDWHALVLREPVIIASPRRRRSSVMSSDMASARTGKL